MPKLEFSCTCGANWSFAEVPADAVQSIAEIWDSEHSGPGHEPTDRDTSRRARERDEAKGGGTMTTEQLPIEVRLVVAAGVYHEHTELVEILTVARSEIEVLRGQLAAAQGELAKRRDGK
jgi:hypothetical protein